MENTDHLHTKKQTTTDFLQKKGISSMKNFEMENNILRKYNGTDTVVTIPAGVTEIGGDVFSGCAVFTIHGKAGSVAEHYARANGIRFQAE